MVQHTLQEVAQAGCRVYSILDVDAQAADDIIAQAMSKAGVKKYEVTFDPPNKNDIDTNMQPVTVTVSVNYSDVAWLTPDFMSGAAVVARCTMPADLEEEYEDEDEPDGDGEVDPSNDDDKDKKDKDKKDKKKKKKK